MRKLVYSFSKRESEGRAEMKDILGGKGANLAEMATLGLPVPPGFTIITEVCNDYYDNDGAFPEELTVQVEENLKKIEKETGKKFGNKKSPLLVSCRSGARESMPGMMDTILNIGLNDQTIEGLIKSTKNELFCYDSYRRFIQMYGEVVFDIEFRHFEDVLTEVRDYRDVQHENELNVDELGEICSRFKEIIREKSEHVFPEDPKEQLWGAMKAVFESWNSPRAHTYRKIQHIPESWGTAVNIQAMVFGNMGDDSGTGVAFTRDPATGEKLFFGEFLLNAQGEDVVAGTRTPQPLRKERKESKDESSLEELFPDVFEELKYYYQKLERHYRDMQDMEFTVEKKKLYMLQTRSGKRTGFAALRIAVEMVEEGLISPREAVMRIEPEQMNHFLAPIFNQKEKNRAIKDGLLITTGLNAGPGAASGRIAFSADKAYEMDAEGDDVILVRNETSPEDIHGMAAANGILTAKGGRTSHAAVVARGMGKCCITGCSELEINYEKEEMAVNGLTLQQGDYISIDGSTGEVIRHRLETLPSEIIQVLIDKTIKPEDSEIFQHYKKFMGWVDAIRAMKVRTNAETPRDSAIAISFGAEGIGLCRTEHMFFEGDRINFMRQMIVADTEVGRKKALEKILPIQREDYKQIFRVMQGRPATIRTLDPPLHEFLPNTGFAIKDLAKKLMVSPNKLQQKVAKLKESNPMLGHRGCRLGIVFPEITEMQVRAILEAAIDVMEEDIDVRPEIMIPLISHHHELEQQRKIVVDTAEKVFAERKRRVYYQVGTMIELPRAALTADRIAENAEFFSFGTNDLTQTTFGISRDDSRGFLPHYVKDNIIPWDPFETLDFDGVGSLLKIGIEKGRNARPGIKIGICGEHGGDPATVKFCYHIGMDYVSCSPYRVPVARLAAAQAAIEKEQNGQNRD